MADPLEEERTRLAGIIVEYFPTDFSLPLSSQEYFWKIWADPENKPERDRFYIHVPSRGTGLEAGGVSLIMPREK